MSLREDYDLPQRTSLGSRMWIVMCAFALAALAAWLISPSSPVAVALLALLFLSVVFAGVAWAMSSRDLRRPPGRNPEPPPSTQ
jgi:membrane protein implicated in regulation of membrane protease activity